MEENPIIIKSTSSRIIIDNDIIICQQKIIKKVWSYWTVWYTLWREVQSYTFFDYIHLFVGDGDIEVYYDREYIVCGVWGCRYPKIILLLARFILYLWRRLFIQINLEHKSITIRHYSSPFHLNHRNDNRRRIYNDRTWSENPNTTKWRLFQHGSFCQYILKQFIRIDVPSLITRDSQTG